MTEDFKTFRRMARYYERELSRIRDATALDADRLREIAANALIFQRQKQKRNKGKTAESGPVPYLGLKTNAI